MKEKLTIELEYGSEVQKKVYSEMIKSFLKTLEIGMPLNHQDNKIKINNK